MTTTAPPAGRLTRARWLVSDSQAIMSRNVRRLIRSPQTLAFSLVQPLMFVVLFRYVFGGAIRLPGSGNYANYLIPGVACQTAIFGSVITAIGLAEDLSKGFIDRLRSLPTARSAILFGRVATDFTRNVLVVGIILLIGAVIGFRPHDLLGLLVGCALLLTFSVSLSFLMACVGFYASSVESAQAMVFPLIFPFTFASSVFVPTSSMPHWLRGFAANQPVGLTASAVRSLFVGPQPAAVRAALFDGQSTTSLALRALAWGAALSAIGLVIATRRFRNLT
jgi:ABC-2 type transport system permease protein/oleandomycin transport system permease protein